MKVSDNALMSVVLGLSALILISHFSIAQQVLPDYLVICIFLLFVSQSYRLTPFYKKKNKLSKLIARKGNTLLVKDCRVYCLMPVSKTQKIDINVISNITVVDEGLSILLNESNLEYEFFLNHDAAAIHAHLEQLLDEQMKKNMVLEVNY